MRRKIAYCALICILLSVFSYSAYRIVSYYRDAAKSKSAFENLQRIAFETEPETSADQGGQETLTENFQKLSEQNADFVCWLSVDGTGISYPVMQNKAEPEYYLRRGFDKKYSYYGTPFIDAMCDFYSSDNVIIYGHNMKNGTMFAELEQYTDKSFCSQHSRITLKTASGTYEYEIAAVVKTDLDSPDSFEYYKYAAFSDAGAFESFMNVCNKNSLYDTGVQPVFGDRLLTLSTCEYSHKNGRLVVIARLL